MPGPELPAANIPRAIVERVESEIDGKKYYTTIQLVVSATVRRTFSIMSISW
jgi:hypothetical protein